MNTQKISKYVKYFCKSLSSQRPHFRECCLVFCFHFFGTFQIRSWNEVCKGQQQKNFNLFSVRRPNVFSENEFCFSFFLSFHRKVMLFCWREHNNNNIAFGTRFAKGTIIEPTLSQRFSVSWPNEFCLHFVLSLKKQQNLSPKYLTVKAFHRFSVRRPNEFCSLSSLGRDVGLLAWSTKLYT